VRTECITGFGPISTWSKLIGMNRIGFMVRIAAIGSILPVSVANCSAQSAQTNGGEAVLMTLSKPSYPPLARQARITGDVELVLDIKADGTIQAVDIVSGHPLLKQAALDSAQHSQFECRKCGETPTSLRLVYTFHLVAPDKCCPETKAHSDDEASGQQVPRVIQSGNHVTVVDQPVCFCDPADTFVKARSFKCLYLWRCGTR
jgi:TonB family protein